MTRPCWCAIATRPRRWPRAIPPVRGSRSPRPCWGWEGIGVMMGGDAAWSPAGAGPVVDTTGAGDAVSAVAVHACLTGMSAHDTAVLASRAAAVAVGSIENTPVALAEV